MVKFPRMPIKILFPYLYNMDAKIKNLENSIIKVFNESGNEISFKHKELKYFKHKYSSAESETLTLFLDGQPLINNKKYRRKVQYRCLCGNIETILLCKFLQKEKLSCPKCRETNEKIEWHKLYFSMKREGKIRGNRNTSHILKKHCFDEESINFKERYFARNLTTEEFKKCVKYIYSIDGICIKNKNVDFLEVVATTNGKKYRQAVKIDEEFHPLTDIYLKCPLCGEIFHITRQLKERVKANNFDCKKCFLNNKTFAVKKINESLNYQSKPELYFITKCQEKGLDIINGPKIPYMFEGKKHCYTIDFYLPELRMAIEIKDNHIWHKRQVTTGKWEQKEKAAKDYCQRNNSNFKLIFSKEIDDFLNNIERDILNV